MAGGDQLGRRLTAGRHKLRLLGAFTADASLSRKARAILAYLSLNPDIPVGRERLAALLWSERGEEQARASLRQCLQELRAYSLGPFPLLDIGRTAVTLWGARVVTDLDEIKAMAQAGDAPGLAMRLAREPSRLLENLDGLDGEFDTWLRVQRAACGDEVLSQAMACAEAALIARPADSLRLAQVILAREPLDESAARLAMRAAQAAREPKEARRIWRGLQETLKRELGVAPSAESAACYEGLTALAPPPGDPPREPAVRAPPTATVARRPRLRVAAAIGLAAAVLAAGVALVWRTPPESGAIRVDRLTSPPDDATAARLADGFAGELARMTEARRSSLNVYAPGSAPKGGAPRYVVDGAARSVAGRLAVTVDVHAAKDGAILWSADFDRPAAEVDILRRQAAARVAEALTCATGQDDPPRDVETVRAYLMVCEKLHDFAASEAASTLLQAIVRRDPHFARAWADLALADAEMATYSDMSPQDAGRWRRGAEAAAGRALALDPRGSQAWVVRALLAKGLGGWTVRQAALGRALRLDPQSALALDTRAAALADIGRERDALAGEARAADLDPLSAPVRESLAYRQAYGVGDLNAGLATLDEAQRLWPDSTQIRLYRLTAIMRMGEPRAARRALDEFATKAITDHWVSGWRLLVAARADPRRAGELTNAIVAHMARAPATVDPYWAMQALTEIGRTDQALDVAFARPATLDRDTDILFRSFMAPLRARPRFMALAGRLGLVRIWRTTGLWPDFCTDPGAPYDCRALAARLAGA